MGWRVFIISGSYDHLTNYQKLKTNERYRTETIDGVVFRWVRVPIYKGNGIGRMYNMLKFFLKTIFPECTRSLLKPDVIIGSNVHLLAVASAKFLARKNKVPFIFEIRDIWPESLAAYGILKRKSIAFILLYQLEGWLLRHSDSIISLLPNIKDYIKSRSATNKIILYLPNGVDVASYPYVPYSDNRNEAFILMFLGSLSIASGLETLLLALKELKKRTLARPLRVRLIGPKAGLANQLEKLARDLELDNVSFESPVPKNQIPKLAVEADAFFAAVPDKPELYRYGISFNKLGDYLIAGRPILMISTIDSNPIVEAQCGIIIQTYDPKELADAIEKLVQITPDEIAALGKRGRRFAEQERDYKILANRLSDFLNETIKSN